MPLPGPLEAGLLENAVKRFRQYNAAALVATGNGNATGLSGALGASPDPILDTVRVGVTIGPSGMCPCCIRRRGRRLAGRSRCPVEPKTRAREINRGEPSSDDVDTRPSPECGGRAIVGRCQRPFADLRSGMLSARGWIRGRTRELGSQAGKGKALNPLGNRSSMGGGSTTA